MAEVIKFNCTYCSQRLGVKVAYAGKRVRCTKCRAVLTVPEQSDSADGAGGQQKVDMEGLSRQSRLLKITDAEDSLPGISGSAILESGLATDSVFRRPRKSKRQDKADTKEAPEAEQKSDAAPRASSVPEHIQDEEEAMLAELVQVGDADIESSELALGSNSSDVDSTQFDAAGALGGLEVDLDDAALPTGDEGESGAPDVPDMSMSKSGRKSRKKGLFGRRKK